MEAARILIIDDDDGIRSTLARFLSLEGYEVIQLSHGRALESFGLSGIALVLLDVNLPGESGFDIARRLRQDYPALGLIMLTGRGDLLDRVLGLELGADDYVLKPFDLRELLARIRSVLRRSQAAVMPAEGEAGQAKREGGGSDAAGQTILFHGWTLSIGGRKVLTPNGTELNLTTTEFDILRLLSEHGGQTVSRAKLYESLRGKDWSPLDRTLDAHMANLRRKMEAAGGAGLIKTVHGQGYMLTVD